MLLCFIDALRSDPSLTVYETYPQQLAAQVQAAVRFELHGGTDAERAERLPFDWLDVQGRYRECGITGPLGYKATSTYFE